jgi:hypothetical protein
MFNQFQTPARPMPSSVENITSSPPVLKRKRSESSYSDYFLPSAKSLPSPMLLPTLEDDLENTPSLQSEDEDLPPRVFLLPRPPLRRVPHPKRKTLSSITKDVTQPRGLTFDETTIPAVFLKKRRTSLMAPLPALKRTLTRRGSWASCA